MGFFSTKSPEPQPYSVKGHNLVCPICQNELFFAKRVQLNTTMLTLLNLDWANRNATCFVCSDCTHILWFDAD